MQGTFLHRLMEVCNNALTARNRQSRDEVALPRFLGVGAPRSGTTWLYKNLKSHPQIWLPPLKELHYFDCQRRGASSYSLVPNANVWRMSWYWYYRHLKQLYGRLAKRRGGIRWTMRYTFGARSDRWYASLFRPDYVSGEITPGYILLPRPVIEDIHRLNPDMKIIMLLRNPVSRAWSAARRALGRKIMRATDAQILDLVDSPKCVMRADYVRAVNDWRGVFGDQVFIGFFDQLVSAPRDLLRSVLQFLNVDSADQFIPETIENVVNSSFKKRELPENLVPHMYETYIDQLRILEKMLGGPVSKWLAKAEEALATRGAVCLDQHACAIG